MFRMKMKTLLRRSFTNKSFDIHWVDEYRGFIQRNSLKFKFWMMKVHDINIAPAFLKPVFLRFSVSDIAGNGSFVFLAISYLENDFLSLRTYALSGIALSIAFQYYREKPLWIPIRWNSVFFLINGVMILFLLKEHNDANNIPQEQKFLFQTVFQSKGMKPVDFLHLINSSERVEYKKGTKIVSQDKRNTKVCLVKTGKLVVSRGNEKVGTINPNQFVGAMSFLTWSGKVDTERAERQLCKDLQKEKVKEVPKEEIAIENEDGIILSSDAIDTISSAEKNNQQSEPSKDSTNIQQSGWADVICEEDCVAFSWDFGALKDLTEANPMMGMVLERCISEDLNRKMANNWQDEPKNRYKQLLTGALMDGEITPEKRAMILKSREELHINDEEHLQVLDMVNWSKEQFEAGYKESPPADILSKYVRNMKRCLEFDGKVTEEDRNSLRKFRKANGISYARHLAILKQLGWTPDQYEAGTRSVETTLEEDVAAEEAAAAAAAKIAASELVKSTGFERFYYLRRAYAFVTTGSTESIDAAAVDSIPIPPSRTSSPIRARRRNVDL